jgi:hypothetical protein
LQWLALQPQEPVWGDGRLAHFILENNTIGYRLVVCQASFYLWGEPESPANTGFSCQAHPQNDP